MLRLAALLLVALIRVESTDAIRVLKNQVLLSDGREGIAISGAKLVPDGRPRRKVTDLTICTRFKIKIIGAYEGASFLWAISDEEQGTEVCLCIVS